MIELYVDKCPDTWDLEWKDWCWGCESEFDQTFVITGNKAYRGVTEAEWYEKAESVISDLEEGYDDDYMLDEYEKEFTKKQRKRIMEAYDRWNGRYREDFVCEILNIMYPGNGFENRDINGYSQGDWQNIIYPGKYKDVIDDIESWYWGKVAEVHYRDTETEEDCWGYVTDNELWRWEREGKVKEEIINFFGLSDDEEYRLFETDDYYNKEWTEVENDQEENLVAKD